MRAAGRGRRVVVTGVGVVSAIGWDADAFWTSVVGGRSGIRPIRRFDAAALPSRIAGEVEHTVPDPLPLLPSRKAAKMMSPSAIFALVAAAEAVSQARVELAACAAERLSVVVGSEVKHWGFDEIVRFAVSSRQGEPSVGADGCWREFSRLVAYKRNPLHFLKNMPNMDAAHLSIAINARGPGSTITTGCTAGLDAVAEGFHLLRRGEADVVVAGGTNACATPMELVHLALQGWLTRRNDDPAGAIRPFDATRDGFAAGEGAAMLVLEELAFARRRRARILAEVRAVSGRSGGAWAGNGNAAAPPEDSLAAALEAAGARACELDLVHAFGMATGPHDRWECASLRCALGRAAGGPAITSIRPLVGMCGPASSALDVAATVLAVERATIPPLANLRSPDPRCALRYARGAALRAPLRLAAVHAIGLEGQSAALVLARVPEGAP